LFPPERSEGSLLQPKCISEDAQALGLRSPDYPITSSPDLWHPSPWHVSHFIPAWRGFERFCLSDHRITRSPDHRSLEYPSPSRCIPPHLKVIPDWRRLERLPPDWRRFQPSPLFLMSVISVNQLVGFCLPDHGRSRRPHPHPHFTPFHPTHTPPHPTSPHVHPRLGRPVTPSHPTFSGKLPCLVLSR
jgi:hypothetical protein